MKPTQHPPFSAATSCIVAVAAALSLTSCDVKQTQEAKAPTVEVSPGQLPKYDVDAAKVTVDSQKKEVTVPKVTTEQKTISVPDVNITMPGQSPAPAGSPATAPAESPATAPTP
ncbi:MAG: hypothetical protein AVDCRST_MAG42-2544 [uncultured Chthoniobacterales bacterium]|uniref:Uncharacterized protein n=1 Tax=uncultured Chthoniobacterales bacterium TaxID=1836801 RepID=A0A6J4IQT5_9BACT|nr:MAG: hypothetical protein AVDCRST_MAG42-2544 [uncultured Chthoniobacterales bacterium]